MNGCGPIPSLEGAEPWRTSTNAGFVRSSSSVARDASGSSPSELTPAGWAGVGIAIRSNRSLKHTKHTSQRRGRSSLSGLVARKPFFLHLPRPEFTSRSGPDPEANANHVNSLLCHSQPGAAAGGLATNRLSSRGPVHRDHQAFHALRRHAFVVSAVRVLGPRFRVSGCQIGCSGRCPPCHVHRGCSSFFCRQPPSQPCAAIVDM